MTVSAVAGWVSRILLFAGVTVGQFAGYQVWGTGVATAAAQTDLAATFAERVETGPVELAVGVDRDAPDGAFDPTVRAGGEIGERPAAGIGTDPDTDTGQGWLHPSQIIPNTSEPVAVIQAPAAGIDHVVVEGISRDDLTRGPGRYPQTAAPGYGHTAIAGHRTTHGAPFADIDQLAVGDPIMVTTVAGTVTYRVVDVDGDGDGHRIVSPSDVSVLDPTDDNRLTLTACHPRYSAAERIVVTAVAETPPAVPPSVAESVEVDPVEVLASEPVDAAGVVVWDSANRPPAPEPASTVSSSFDDAGWRFTPAVAGWTVVWALVAAGCWVVGRRMRDADTATVVTGWVTVAAVYVTFTWLWFGQLVTAMPAI